MRCSLWLFIQPRWVLTVQDQKGVQWSAQLLAECSGWLKCDKAKLKSTAGKELTFWFSA